MPVVSSTLVLIDYKSGGIAELAQRLLGCCDDWFLGCEG
jgi:hypothetical protein